MRILHTCLLTALCLTLPACGNSHDTPLKLYIERLSRSLGTDIEEPTSRLPLLPSARVLQLPITSSSIGLLDLLALSDCALHVTIARRNSSLGKVAPPSQRLLMDLEFLDLAPACIRSLANSEKQNIADTLQLALKEKQEQLPARIWNATLGGREFREFWKQPPGLSDYPARLSTSLPTDLQRLVKLSETWLAGNVSAGREELEPLLGRIREGDGGALLKALSTQADTLALADQAIEERIAQRPLCFQGRPSPKGVIFENVIRRFFIGQVQPWSVQLDQRRRALMPPLLALESLLNGAIPPPYREWAASRDQTLKTATAGPRRHAKGIYRLLETCDLHPGESA